MPDGQQRRSWEASRQARITKPAVIEVKLRYDQFAIRAANIAEVTINQTYHSDVYSDVTTKLMKLRNDNGAWKIIAERVLE